MTTKIEKIENSLLGEYYFRVEHKSGLTVLVMPKEGYSSTYALFGTKYGSIDNCFKVSGDESPTRVPEGIAHFLEHKLFESEDLDAFERYAKTGASANAYTSFDRTCYLFSCTGNFKANLEILLDFVQSPYFTEKTVEKEQGIIGQEIRMYKDVPGWEVLFNLLRAMYHNHPVKIDIAGTEETIAQIDDKLLYKCYETFYNLNNMALAVVGNVELDEVLEVCDRLLKPSRPQSVERIFENEPEEVVESFIEEELSVSNPVFNLGFKETWLTPERTLKEEICADILLEIIAGNTSQLYRELIDKKLVNTTFTTEYFIGTGFAAKIFSGESADPRTVAELIREKIRVFKENGISQEDFDMAKKKLFGRTIMAFNDIDNLADSLIKAEFLHEGLFDDMELFRNLTLEEINEHLRKTLDERYCVLSVINPAKE
ncbi:MAG: insulinase family protein [Clostridia bacterium]|nr:insulinase family protein [Clostridia bacterium]